MVWKWGQEGERPGLSGLQGRARLCRIHSVQLHGKGDGDSLQFPKTQGEGARHGPLTPFSSLSLGLRREALSRRVRRLAVRMRARDASQRPLSQRPRVSPRPRSQNNIYSACPRRARAADQAGEQARDTRGAGGGWGR